MKRYSLEEALIRIQEVSEDESDGGEVSDISDVDWSEEESSESQSEPPRAKQKKKFEPAGPSVKVSTSGNRAINFINFCLSFFLCFLSYFVWGKTKMTRHSAAQKSNNK